MRRSKFLATNTSRRWPRIAFMPNASAQLNRGCSRDSLPKMHISRANSRPISPSSILSSAISTIPTKFSKRICGEAARRKLSAVRQRSKILHTQRGNWRSQSKSLACQFPTLPRNFILPAKIDIVPGNFSPDWRLRSLRFIPEAAATRRTGRCRSGLSLEIIYSEISMVRS